MRLTGFRRVGASILTGSTMTEPTDAPAARGAAQPTAAALPALMQPTTMTEARRLAFARRFLQTVDPGEAFRDTFHPAEDLEPKHTVAGNKLIKEPDVAAVIREYARPAMVDAGVELQFVLSRLIGAIDSDITDFATDDGGFMDLAEMKQLPPEKRRLVRKYAVRPGKFGDAVSLELEPKLQSLELLSRILGLVQPASVTVNNNSVAMFQGMTNEQLKAEIQRRLSDPGVAAAVGVRPAIEHSP